MPDRGRATRLFLVRHGKVDNPDQLAYGHLPRFGLDVDGRAQAHRAGEWLADKSVIAIYTSPLLRARQTTHIIRAALCDVPVHRSRRLIESGLARHWQGLPWQEIERVHPELFAQFQSTPSQITTGESMAEMARRVASICRQAARRYPGATVALVSHRDPILSLRLSLEGEPDALNQTPCQTASITELRADGGNLQLVGYVEP